MRRTIQTNETAPAKERFSPRIIVSWNPLVLFMAWSDACEWVRLARQLGEPPQARRTCMGKRAVSFREIGIRMGSRTLLFNLGEVVAGGGASRALNSFVLSTDGGFKATTISAMHVPPSPPENLVVASARPCFIHATDDGLNECKDRFGQYFFVHNILMFDEAMSGSTTLFNLDFR